MGFEPTTNGLKGGSTIEEDHRVAAAGDPGVTQLARAVLEQAAAGSVRRAALEDLAEAVLQDRRFALAQAVLDGGETALAAGLELAGLITASARPLAVPCRRAGR